MSRLIFLILMSLFLIQCNQSGGGPADTGAGNIPQSTVTEKISYHYSEGDCTTGSHKGTRDEICNVLRINSANNSCASQTRQQLFLSLKCMKPWFPLSNLSKRKVERVLYKIKNVHLEHADDASDEDRMIHSSARLGESLVSEFNEDPNTWIAEDYVQLYERLFDSKGNVKIE